MKRKIFIVGILALFSSCSIISGSVGPILGVATITGKLSHNGPAKKNLVLKVPCQDRNGHEIGEATDKIEQMEKYQKWEFRAKLYNPDVRTCKMTEAKILEEDTDSAASGS